MTTQSQARTKPVADWYFDFISPFSYLQCERLLEVPVAVRPRPLLFAGLLGHWEHKGPAEIASKRRFTYEQIVWLARRDAIPLTFPPNHPFNPIKALRLAIALGGDIDTVRAIFRFIWREGNDAGSDEGWKALCHRMRADDADARIAAPEVKEALKRNGEEAIAAGVFGVPTLVIDGRIFWGYDATPMAHDYLSDPAGFDSAEMKRVGALPVGTARKVVGS
jgi:2-hydroxychromene-2-carboxylate isomerase